MRSLLTYLQIGAQHQRCPSQPHNTSSEEESKRPPSSEAQYKMESGGSTIIVPKPTKPNTASLLYLANYMRMSKAIVSNLAEMRSSSSESGSEGGIQSDGTNRFSSEKVNDYSIPRKLSKEERAAKVQKYWEKKKRKTYDKKIRYEYRQHLADKRMRFQGRFVKAEHAKDLIMRGASITVKDKAELTKLFEEDNNSELIKKYEENMKMHSIKSIFRTVQDTSVRDGMSSSESDSSGSMNAMSASFSPSLESMKDIYPSLGMNMQDNKLEIPSPSMFKL